MTSNAMRVLSLACALSALAGASAGAESPTPGKPAWVFHDGVMYWPGDYSYVVRVQYNDKEGAPASGRYDVKITLTGQWGGFQPFARNWDFDTRPYAYLTFALKPTIANQALKLYFEKVGDVPVGNPVDPLKYGPAPQPGVWATYKVPLADLGLSGIRVYKFAIQDQTGLASNVFYLNDVGFLPPD